LYLAPKLGPVHLQRLTDDQLSRFYRDLMREGGQDGAALSPSMVRRVHNTAHGGSGMPFDGGTSA